MGGRSKWSILFQLILKSHSSNIICFLVAFFSSKQLLGGNSPKCSGHFLDKITAFHDNMWGNRHTSVLKEILCPDSGSLRARPPSSPTLQASCDFWPAKLTRLYYRFYEGRGIEVHFSLKIYKMRASHDTWTHEMVFCVSLKGEREEYLKWLKLCWNLQNFMMISKLIMLRIKSRS